MSTNGNTSTPSDLFLEVPGAPGPIRLRATEVKDKPGKFWWVTRQEGKKANMAGTPIPALDDELPTSVTLDGVTFKLTKGLSAASYTDRETKKTVTVPDNERREVARFEGNYELPSVGEEKHVTIRFSRTKTEGVWQFKATVNGAGTGAGGATVESATKMLAGLL
jgi:hypothetical protein